MEHEDPPDDASATSDQDAEVLVCSLSGLYVALVGADNVAHPLTLTAHILGRDSKYDNDDDSSKLRLGIARIEAGVSRAQSRVRVNHTTGVVSIADTPKARNPTRVFRGGVQWRELEPNVWCDLIPGDEVVFRLDRERDARFTLQSAP